MKHLFIYHSVTDSTLRHNLLAEPYYVDIRGKGNRGKLLFLVNTYYLDLKSKYVHMCIYIHTQSFRKCLQGFRVLA